MRFFGALAKKDGKLVEGVGEQEEVGNKLRFRNISKLKYAG